MSLVDRDASASEALLTDLYLDALLAGAAVGTAALDAADLDPAARRAGDRLRRDLVRVHPSFRFEERLATRLAETALAMRMPAAAGAEGRVVPFRSAAPALDDQLADAGELDPGTGTRDLTRPILIGGAFTSAALSIAGAALVAWRLGRPGRTTAPMVRAARAARSARLAGATTASATRALGSRQRPDLD